jgi:small subunit ribosomal protein S17
MFSKLQIINNALRQQKPFSRVTPLSRSGLVNACRSTAFRLFSSTETEYEKEIGDIEKDYAERKKRVQSLMGEVVSVKCHKTVNVMVYNQKLIKKYSKHIQTRKKVMAHDENCVGKLGDLVRIAVCRPMSKMKRHYLIDVIRRAPSLNEAGEAEISDQKVEMNVNVTIPPQQRKKPSNYLRDKAREAEEAAKAMEAKE